MTKFINIFMFSTLIVTTIATIGTKADLISTNKGTIMKFGMQVVMTATPGKGEELASIMLKAAKLVSKLKGCQVYIVQLSTSEKDTVLITEVWNSEEDHKASLSVPEIRELIGKAKPLIVSLTHHMAKPLGGVGI